MVKTDCFRPTSAGCTYTTENVGSSSHVSYNHSIKRRFGRSRYPGLLNAAFVAEAPELFADGDHVATLARMADESGVSSDELEVLNRLSYRQVADLGVSSALSWHHRCLAAVCSFHTVWTDG